MSLTVTIVGVGLVGGSLGLALHDSRLVSRIIGVDADPDTLHKALNIGAIDVIASLEDGARQADILFLCTPLTHFPGLIERLARSVSPGTIVTDVGSTKQMVMDWLSMLPDGVWPIGGHPMAGSEINGINGADRYLFENAVYILTPPVQTPEQVLQTLSEVLTVTGARIKIMDAATHDRLVAAVSHIPHLAAVSLVNLTEAAPEKLILAAGGFRDTTRVASSSPEVWQGILGTNRTAVIAGLEQLIDGLEQLRDALQENQTDTLLEHLQRARDIRNQIPHGQKGLMPSICDVICIVPDRPGVIGELGRILGRHNINIADIEILRVREGDGGTIRLGVPSLEDGQQSVKALKSEGIKAWVR